MRKTFYLRFFRRWKRVLTLIVVGLVTIVLLTIKKPETSSRSMAKQTETLFRPLVIPIGKTYICDSYLSLKCPLAKQFAQLLYPNSNITIYKGQDTSKEDILIVVCGCSHAEDFSGIILYGDNGHGIIHLQGVSQKKVVYAGVNFPMSNDLILKQIDMFFAAITFSLYSKDKYFDSFQQRQIMTKKRSFLIYHSHYCLVFETKVFTTLTGIAKFNGFDIPVDTGNCSLFYTAKLNKTEFVFNDNDHTINIMEKFRFALVMERTNAEGYVTERILNAFLAGTIPIYYGTKDVFKLFNANSFIYYDINNPQAAIDQIIYLETNREAYQSMINQPILANGEQTLREYFSLTNNIGGGMLRYNILNTVRLAQSKFLDQPTRFLTLNHSKVNIIANNIRTFRTFVPFYMYNDAEFADILQNCTANERPDKMLLKMFQTHPWRTHSPSEAKVFIIPIPLLDSYRCDRKGNIKRLEKSLREISSNVYFKRYYGRDHLLMAHAWQLSVWTWKRLIAADDWWDNFSQVTATRFEYFGMSKWEDSLSYEKAKRVPKQMFAMQWEPTRRSIIVPYETPVKFQIITQNYTEWDKRPNFIWYHCKPSSFLHEATTLRQLPVKQRHLFPGDIGFDIPATNWTTGWSKSKFCFVMRGDTPTSHSFYNAISSSCIPVVISDAFELVGLPFKHIVPLKSVAIIFPENQFLKNPESLVLFLKQLTKKEIENKLLNIKIIQPIFVIRHAKSILPELILQETSNYIDNIFNMH